MAARFEGGRGGAGQGLTAEPAGIRCPEDLTAGPSIRRPGRSSFDAVQTYGISFPRARMIAGVQNV